MAGFVRPKKTYLLKFDEGDFARAEVRVAGASVDQLMGLMDLARFAEGDFSVKDIKEIDQMINLFASKLIEWNLIEEDGTPITFKPIVDREERETLTEAKVRVLRDQDMDFVMTLVLAWVEAVIGTPAPLDEKSSDGEQSVEESIPMAILSENQLL